MTLTSTANKTSYTGDASTTDFATVFAFKGTGATAELEVVERVIATGVETVKTYSTHYTVTGGNGSTGTVIAVSAPAATLEWHIRRTTTKTQLTDYVTNDAFAADTHEAALDRLAMIGNEIQEVLDRALVFPVSDASLTSELPSSVDRANKTFGFDASGNVELTTTIGNWQGAWVTSTAYVLNDVVSNSGSSYICIVAHTSGTFATDLAALKWELVAQKGAQGDAGAGDMSDLVDDLTPQLGGPLSGNSFQMQWSKGADVVCANALPLLTDGNYFDITTGVDTVTSMATTAVGNVVLLQTDVAVVFTHDGDNIVLPASKNITTAAGDHLWFIEHATGKYTLVGIKRALGELWTDSAVGTDGVILSYDASGLPVFVGPGTSGQVLTSGGAGAPPTFEDAGGGTLTLTASQATASGTAKDFTVPTTATEIYLFTKGCSTNGTNDWLIQIGDAGGVDTTGYVSNSTMTDSASGPFATNSTSGYVLYNDHAGTFKNLTICLYLYDTTNHGWIASAGTDMGSSRGQIMGGEHDLGSGSAGITTVRLNGVDTFDAGDAIVGYR